MPDFEGMVRYFIIQLLGERASCNHYRLHFGEVFNYIGKGKEECGLQTSRLVSAGSNTQRKAWTSDIKRLTEKTSPNTPQLMKINSMWYNHTTEYSSTVKGKLLISATKGRDPGMKAKRALIHGYKMPPAGKSTLTATQ